MDGRKIVIVVAVLTLIFAGIFGGVFYWKNYHKTSANNQTNQSQNQSQKAVEQWALEAKASSSYGGTGNGPFTPFQATGQPNVDKYGNNGNAWASKNPNDGTEWIELKYDKAVYASSVKIKESSASGAVTQIELIDTQGKNYIVWKDKDKTQGLNFLEISFPGTSYQTRKVKITLDTKLVKGWNQIDAVQLIGKETK